jgi:hypothetical protein
VRFHAPYFAQYATDDLDAMFAGAGLAHTRRRTRIPVEGNCAQEGMSRISTVFCFCPWSKVDSRGQHGYSICEVMQTLDALPALYAPLRGFRGSFFRCRLDATSTNIRDDKAQTKFWKPSFEQRRCLIPASSYCEPKGEKPATWHWFSINGDGARPVFAFPGVWTRYRGPLKER